MPLNRFFGCLFIMLGLAATSAHAQYLDVPRADTPKAPPAQSCFVSTKTCSGLSKLAPKPCRIGTDECGAIGGLVAIASNQQAPRRSAGLRH
jgi:hypothetical protein